MWQWIALHQLLRGCFSLRRTGAHGQRLPRVCRCRKLPDRSMIWLVRRWEEVLCDVLAMAVSNIL